MSIALFSPAFFFIPIGHGAELALGEYTFHQAADLDGWSFPENWMRERFSFQQENGLRFARVSARPTRAFRYFEVPPAAVTLVVEARVRGTGVRQGDNPWNIPSIQTTLHRGHGEELNRPWPTAIKLSEDTDGWQTLQSRIAIPAEADRGRLLLVHNGPAGDFDIASIRVATRTDGERELSAEQRRERRQAEMKQVANRTRPANPNDPNRPPRRTDESVITGGNVDESGIETTVHVDGQRGDDTNNGLRRDSPVRTFERGVELAMEYLNAGRGTKILLQPGVYRPAATVVIDGGDGTAREALLVIEGAKKGEVVISGAHTEGFEPERWERIDAERRIYRIDWPHRWEMIDRGYYSIPYVELHRRELLAFNGKRMQARLLEAWSYTDRRGRVYDETGLLIEENRGAEGGYRYLGFQGIDKLEPGEFSVQVLGPGDEEYDDHPHPHSVLFRLPEDVESLEGNEIALGMLGTILHTRNKSNLVMRNLNFQHASGYYNGPDGAALLTAQHWNAPITGRNWLIEHCGFSENNVSAMNLFSVEEITIRHTDVINNGGRGIHSIRVNNAVFQDMNLTHNNARGKRVGYVKHGAGGWDYRMVDVLFERVNASHNYGNGFRGDVVASNNIFRDCRMNHNARGGMLQEISWGPILVDNCEIIGNGLHAVLILNVHDLLIQNSRMEDNERGLWIINSPRRQTVADADRSIAGETDPDNPNVLPIRMNLNTELRDNIFISRGEANLIERSDSAGNPQLYVEWYSDQYTGSGNVFHNPDRTDVFSIGPQWEPRTFTDLDGWREATGQDRDSRWGPPAEE